MLSNCAVVGFFDDGYDDFGGGYGNARGGMRSGGMGILYAYKTVVFSRLVAVLHIGISRVQTHRI